MNEVDKNKTKYFVIAIILLIILGVILIIHFNNKSLVSGDKDTDNTTKKTTEKVDTEEKTTTKRVTTPVPEVAVVEPEKIYKSVIDEENNLIYEYMLTDEISDTDKIVSQKLYLEVPLIEKGVISVFDISLYDIDMNKKTVNNSLINISIPIVDELVGYDEYKVVYITDDNQISDEEFNTTVSDGYINFSTTHLSKFGIIGTKKNIEEPVQEDTTDLSKASISLALNNKSVTESDVLYVTNDDGLAINVSGVDGAKIYYAFKGEDVSNITYSEYVHTQIFKNITTYQEATLMVKLVVGNKERVFELNKVKVYDIIYEYDNNEVPTDGNIPSVGGENKNVLLQDGTNKDVEPVEGETVLKVEGNMYVVDEADLTKLDMTGSLYIDTDKKITFDTTEEEKINTSKLDYIYITSEYFNINGKTYRYEIKDGILIIYEVTETTNEDGSTVEQEDDVTENFGNLFENGANVTYDEENDNLAIEVKKNTDTGEKTSTEENEPQEEIPEDEVSTVTEETEEITE